jgi:hypothetical protein
VDKVAGKALSSNDFTDSDSTKLLGIAAGAEVNVQSDWNQSDSSADDFIKNKPTIPPPVPNYWSLNLGTISTEYDVNMVLASIDTADIASFYVADDTIHRSDKFYLWPTDTGRLALVGQGMIWPSSSGIVTYDGETWGASIADNSTNWNTAYTYRVTSASGTAPLTLSLSSNAITGSISQAGASTNGYLSSTDWNTFNNKQNALTNPITGYGVPGRVAVFNDTTRLASYRLATINGQTLLDSVDIDIPTFSEVVPYSGATDTVALGSFGLSAAYTQVDTSYIGLSAIYSNADLFRFIALPDSSGTIALTSQIPDISNFVIKVAGKALSSNDFTDSDSTKLLGIAAGAEVNVNADWNATSGDAQILNKPTIPDVSGFVPYANANQSLDMNGNGITAGDISADLVTSSTVEAYDIYASDVNVSNKLFNGTDSVSIGNSGVLAVLTDIPGPEAEADPVWLSDSSDYYKKTVSDGKYQLKLTNPITGTGTANYLPKFTGTGTIGNSKIYDNGTNVGIGTTNPDYKTHIYGTSAAGSVLNALKLENNQTTGTVGTEILFKNYYNSARIVSSHTPTSYIGGNLQIQTWKDNSTWNTGMYMDRFGNVGIGTTSTRAPLTVRGSNSGTFSTEALTLQANDFDTNGGVVSIYKTNGLYDGSYGVIQVADNGNYRALAINPFGGNVGIGYSTGTEITNNKLAVNGSLYANGAISGTSYKVSGNTLFTAPLTSGTAGALNYMLIGQGATSAPVWTPNPWSITGNYISTPYTINADTADFGELFLSGKIQSGSGAEWTMPASTGTLALTSDIPSPVDISGKVDKVAGKALSSNDFTDSDSTKLLGIAAGAEVNVNADWNATSGDAQILNKPTIPDVSGFVPYANANQSLDMNGNGITAGDISADLVTSSTVEAYDIYASDVNVSNKLFNGTDSVSIGNSGVLAVLTDIPGPEAEADPVWLSDSSDYYKKTVSDGKYQLKLTNPITGTGTANYLPKFTGTGTIGNSKIYDNGTNVGIGTTNPDYKTHIYGTSAAGSVLNALKLENNQTTGTVGTEILFKNYYNSARIVSSHTPTSYIGGNLQIQTWKDNSTWNTGMYMDRFGNVGIGTTSTRAPLTVRGSNSGTFSTEALTLQANDFDTNGGVVSIYKTNGLYDGSYGVIQVADNGNYRALAINPFGGNVGIGYSTGTEITNNKLAVNGSLYANGAISGTSYKVSGNTLFTAPLTSGTAGALNYMLIGQGATSAPVWTPNPWSITGNYISTPYTINADTADFGELFLSGKIQSGSGAEWTMPASTGTLALTSDIPSPVDISGKVDKVAGKALSSNDFTDSDSTKLLGIAAGAEVNVQSDWNQSDSSADDFIKNKPTIPPPVPNYWSLNLGTISTEYDVNMVLASIDTADIASFYVADDTIHRSDKFYLWPTDTGRLALVGQGMIWPSSSGIVTYDGETWGASIADNSTNWNTAYTYRVTSASGTAPLTLSLSSNAITGSISQAGASTNGYLSSTDWNTFNNKQNALTNPITGYGVPGRVAVFNGTTTIASYRLATINGQTLLDSVDIAVPAYSSDTTEFTTTIDLSVNKIYYRTLTGSGDVSISVSNLAANRCATVKITTSGYTGTITFVRGVGSNASSFSIVETGVTYFDIQGVNENQYVIKNVQEL